MRSLLRTGLLLLPLLAAGCDHIEYHPYDTDISGEQNINAKNIARIEAACRGRQTVRFAMISDTQRWYDETEKAVEALNARDDIDFVLHGGDLSDFGLKKEFMSGLHGHPQPPARTLRLPAGQSRLPGYGRSGVREDFRTV